MLNNYTYTTTSSDATTAATLCAAAEGKEITVLSIMINGGEEGGDITLMIDNYKMAFTIAAEDTIVLDHKIVVVKDKPLQVTASTAGIKLCVSVAELDVDNASSAN